MAANQYNYPISKIFSINLLDWFNNSELEGSIKSLLVDSGIYPARKRWDFKEAVNLAYKHLKVNYRCEYLYKNEIANQLLLKYHSDNSATLLKELCLNQSIADIVIINGISTVYEVKTELDSLERLRGQVEEYEQVFDEVYVVTYKEAVDAVKRIVPSEVGVLILDGDGNLITTRCATSSGQTDFNSDMAARILRQGELALVYKQHTGTLPNVGTGQIGNVYREWYSGLKTDVAHKIFNECLKSRKLSDAQFQLVKQLPPELRMLLLGRELRKKDCIALSYALNISA